MSRSDTRPPRVLVVDDEQSIRHVLSSVLSRNGAEVRLAASAEEAETLIDSWEPDLALVDVILPGRNGIDFVGTLRARFPDVQTLVMTSNTSADTAVRAMRQGAADYIEKPFDLGEITITIQRTLEKRKLEIKNRELVEREDERTHQLSSAIPAAAKKDAESEAQALVEILDYFLELVTNELGVERASVMLVDLSAGELQLAAAHGLPSHLAGLRVPSNAGIAGSVVQNGESLVVEDVTRDPRMVGRVRKELSTSFISVPIRLRGSVAGEARNLGVINVTNRCSGEPLGPADATFLLELADRLAQAIDRVRSSGQLRRAYETLRATQDQLLFTERLKAVGEMAAGLAHDVNNALSVILARAQVAMGKLDSEPATVHADLATIVRTARQAAETMRRVRNFTRLPRDVPHFPVDLNQVLEDAIEICKPKWRNEAEAAGRRVDVRLEPDKISPVSGNPDELIQVASNLIFNAIEAMPGGGRITLRTRQEQEWVVLEVEDTGQGMDEETQRRVFDPFFTTKSEGQGLGMSIVHGIIGRHGGEITVRSDSGQGTRFTVRLRPRAGSEIDEQVEVRAVPTAGRALRVLLVDDDDAVREVYAEALEIEGHRVRAESDGVGALSAIEAGVFDLVVTDLSMPGLSGIELTVKLKALRPGLPVILFSGWADPRRAEEIRRAGVDMVLDKPCAIETMLAAVRGVAGAETVSEVQ